VWTRGDKAALERPPRTPGGAPLHVRETVSMFHVWMTRAIPKAEGPDET
jgi:hypothetical protein